MVRKGSLWVLAIATKLPCYARWWVKICSDQQESEVKVDFFLRQSHQSHRLVVSRPPVLIRVKWDHHLVGWKYQNENIQLRWYLRVSEQLQIWRTNSTSITSTAFFAPEIQVFEFQWLVPMDGSTRWSMGWSSQVDLQEWQPPTAGVDVQKYSQLDFKLMYSSWKQ